MAASREDSAAAAFSSMDTSSLLVAAASVPSSSQRPLSLLSLPMEIHSKVLQLLDPTDVLSYARTCRSCLKFADSQLLWKHQWCKLCRKTPFTFLPVSSLVDLGVNFKDMCRRLWKVMVTEWWTIGGLSPVRCVGCKEYTCNHACILNQQSQTKLSIDIGGKMTRLITSGYSLQKHLSMIAVPKLLKCYDCDTSLSREEMHCDCSPVNNPQDLHGGAKRETYCHNRRMTSHTALEYCSQPLSDIWVQPIINQPFCLFCDQETVDRMLWERDIVSSTKFKMMSVRPPYMSGEEEFNNYNAVSPLANGYCRDTTTILGANNMDLLSPSLALEHEEAFPVVKAFLAHLFKEFKMIDDLQRPNCSLIVTVGKMSAGMKESIIKFLFEEMKISRLCLLPKPLATSYLFEVSTCIVIDSGATSTSVWVVIDGRVDDERTQSISVGGWHVSQFLKQAITWKGNVDATGVVVSSLDMSAVKQKCRMSLNLARESEHLRMRNETLHIRAQKDAHRKLEMTEVSLSSELYLAPEMMYASLDLPGMVKEATKDLPDYLIKDCFSHILLSGGNTDLEGFAQRISSDLREHMPEHAPVINVCPFQSGNHSWNSIMGANTVKVPPPYEDILRLHESGSTLWMTREEYIVFGCHQLASEEERRG